MTDLGGRFISFEGPEGSGKSTQIRRLAERLEAEGVSVISTREPGGTATGELVRDILQHDAAGEPLDERAELLLFAACRAQLVRQVILPALERGDWVLCDRFVDSTLAYQGYARGMELATLERINDFAIHGRLPDLTILLDLDVERGFQRVEKRCAATTEEADRFEREARGFHRRVREGYRLLAEREPNRIRVVEADRTIDEVASSVWNTVREALLVP